MLEITKLPLILKKIQEYRDSKKKKLSLRIQPKAQHNI